MKKHNVLFKNMQELYDTDESFKIFVDKCCKTYKLTKDICLLHKTVQEVGLYYIQKKTELVARNPETIVMEKIFDEDKAC